MDRYGPTVPAPISCRNPVSIPRIGELIQNHIEVASSQFLPLFQVPGRDPSVRASGKKLWLQRVVRSRIPAHAPDQEHLPRFIHLPYFEITSDAAVVIPLHREETPIRTPAREVCRQIGAGRESRE